MAQPQPITRKAATAQLVKHNLRMLAASRLISPTSKSFVLSVYDELECGGRFPSEDEIAEISEIRAVACFKGDP